MVHTPPRLSTAVAIASGPEVHDAHAVHRINFLWFVRLRWAAVIGKAAVIGLVNWPLGMPLPLLPLGVIIGIEVASNVALSLWLQRRPRVAEWMLAAAMALDVCLFTALLFWTGGPFNPFSFLYLVYISLAALVLSPRWTWALVLIALAGSAALFLEHVPLEGVDHGAHAHHGAHAGHAGHAGHATSGEPLSMHLRGMWVAFGVAAAFIVYFLHRVRSALADREAELAAFRDQKARGERLASVATLAAGAAHELATPLSTIAVIAKELERVREPSGTAEDARLIREQVDRCRNILSQMRGDAGDSPGEAPAPVELGVLIEEVVRETTAPERVRVSWGSLQPGDTVVVPRRAFGQALRAIVNNGLDASPEELGVEVSFSRGPDGFVSLVRDEGTGMSAEVRARATEPFYTTKPPGRGMGLGLFLARSVLEFLGGRLDIESEPGHGTRVFLTVPDGPR